MSTRSRKQVVAGTNSRISADLKCIVAERDLSTKSSLLLATIEDCTTDDWPHLNAVNIIGIIKRLIMDPKSPNLEESLRAYTAYLNLALELEYQDNKTIQNAVIKSLESAMSICTAIWSELEGDLDPDPNFLDSLSNFLHNITQFTAHDAYSRYLKDLIVNDSINFLAMYCVLCAPTDSIEEKADLSRICLMSIGTPDKYAEAIDSFFTGDDPEYHGDKLKSIIKKGTINPSSLVECMVFLDYLSAKYPAKVKLPPDLWKNYISVLRHIIDFDGIGYDIKLLTVYHANVCLKKHLDGSTDQIAKTQLAKMFSRHDLAELIADIALMIATIWFTDGASELRRHSLTCCFPKGGRKKILSVFKEPTVFLVRWLIEHLKRPGIRDLLAGALKPTWHKTLKRMRDLDHHDHPGAPAVIKIWSELGDQISINLLMDPLVGCTWVGCRLFAQDADDDNDGADVLVCTGCSVAQYCSERCQRRDWKKHKGLCTMDHKIK